MGQYVSAALARQSRQFAGWQRRTISSPNFATIHDASPRPLVPPAGRAASPTIQEPMPEPPRRLAHPSRSLMQIARQEDVIVYSLPRDFVAPGVVPEDGIIFILVGNEQSWQLAATPLSRADALRESENAAGNDIHWGACFRADPSNIIILCPAAIANPALDLVRTPRAAQVMMRTTELRVQLSLAYRTRAIARIIAYLPTSFVVPMFPKPTVECILDFISGPRDCAFASLDHCQVNVSGFMHRYIVAASCATHKYNSWDALPRERLEIAALSILSSLLRVLGDNAPRAVIIFPACFRDVCSAVPGDREMLPGLFFIDHRI